MIWILTYIYYHSKRLQGASTYFLEALIGNLLDDLAVSTKLIILLGDIAIFYGVSKSQSS